MKGKAGREWREGNGCLLWRRLPSLCSTQKNNRSFRGGGPHEVSSQALPDVADRVALPQQFVFFGLERRTALSKPPARPPAAALMICARRFTPGGSSYFSVVHVRLAPAVLFSHNKSAISNQSAVIFSQSKPAPAIGH
jgi:hypothetical protein